MENASYAKRILYSEQPTVLLARRHLNTMILVNFEHLNSISNILRKTHDFLVLMDPVIICIYSRTTNRHFRDQRSVGHPTSKLLKCDLVQTLSTFHNPSLRIFAAGKACLVEVMKNKMRKMSMLFFMIFTGISICTFFITSFCDLDDRSLLKTYLLF